MGDTLSWIADQEKLEYLNSEKYQRDLVLKQEYDRLIRSKISNLTLANLFELVHFNNNRKSDRVTEYDVKYLKEILKDVD